ncbi:hypothetical protein [Metabacillus malikii]|uniref:Membrane protein YphA (DoxX/SURF4 family) n=1 Tax=Metabacillus malikii TaxID=1504265 RepID=A0ABT9ZDP8_9BACI|nr:hypothetical protein [Metabacillus malikii]MDQ0230386.1 putative membrane protein YphA (DoxX/SURF4 family) [Metabacillus malikii]
MKGLFLNGVRIFLGILFLTAGINGYFVIFGLEPFISTSPQAMALFEFDYLLVAEKSLEIICGILLLINRYLPLALAILTPIIANILLLHLFVDHSLLILAVVMTCFHCYLLYCYRNNFLSLLEKRPS